MNVHGASTLGGDVAAPEEIPRTRVPETGWLYAPWGRDFFTAMLRRAARAGVVDRIAAEEGVR